MTDSREGDRSKAPGAAPNREEEDTRLPSPPPTLPGRPPSSRPPQPAESPSAIGAIPEPTIVRFRNARKAFEEAHSSLDGAAIQLTTSPGPDLPGQAPPPARRSMFRRLLVSMLAVLAIYGALTQLLAYRLGANVLSDAFQQQLVAPALVSLEDSVADLLVSSQDPAILQSFLDRRYGSFPRLSLAIYSPTGELLAQHAGTPGPAPGPLSASTLRQIEQGEEINQPIGLGFAVLRGVRTVDEDLSRKGPLAGILRLSAQPSTTQTRNLIWEASWRWAFPVFLLSVLMAYLGTRSITLRLRQAEATVRRMAAGDMSARLPVEQMDELGRVAFTFNRTADLLQRTVEQLEDTNETRRRLVGDFAHELNTPLTNVLAYLETLVMAEEEGGMDSTTRLGFIQVAHDEASRLAHLAKDLETLTKLEMGNFVLERDLVDVSRLAVELARRVIPRAEKAGLEVFTDIEPGGDVVGDQMRLEQVGMNLLENALRYTKSGSLTISVACHDAGVTLGISDTGIGIPKGDLPHVMTRFYRVDPSRQRATGGSGLGLAIVGRIISRHGGRVSVDSTVDEGTTVSVWLPREGQVGEDTNSVTRPGWLTDLERQD